jgi:hypothetical protein
VSLTRRLAGLEGLRPWGWLPHVLIGGLALPFVLRQNAWFEWTNTLWLLELQTAHVSAHGLPSFFIDGAGMYFYPAQLFYAGPMLSALAYPSIVFGAWPVFAAASAGAFAAASAGVAWTARNLGVSPRLAFIPGVLFAATPYTVSNLYGRGDWAELVAVSALAVALGAATSLLTDRARSRPAVVAALAVAVGAIAGTHNLTLLFSALLAPALAVALLPLLRGSGSELTARYGLVVAGAVLGLALCGAFLVPDVWLSGRTLINRYSNLLITEVNGFDRPGIIFDPLPGQPRGMTSTDLHTQTLVAALVWTLVVAAFAAGRRQLDRRTTAALTVLALTAIGLTLLIADPAWWLSFPAAVRAIQFPFRLVSYLALVTVLAIGVLLGGGRLARSRAAVAALLLVTVWQVGLAVHLAVTARALPTQFAQPESAVTASAPPIAFSPGQQQEFRFSVRDPVTAPTARARVARIGDDSPSEITLFGSQRAGSFVATEVIASPLIRFSGDVSVSGVTAGGEYVLHVNRSPWRAEVRPVCGACLGALTGDDPLALLAGRVLTVVAVLVLILLLAQAARLRRPRRQGVRA